MMRLAVPCVAIQIGLILMGVVDSMMVGRLSAAALAAVALGHMYFFALSVLGMGVIMALDPVVSQAVGARDAPAISRAMQRGLILSVVLTVPLSLGLVPAASVFSAMRQPADVVPSASVYVRAVLPSIFPFFAFIVFRQTLQAMLRTGPILLVIVLTNIINVLLNWMLIFGHFGFPAMGVAGAGWATTLARWIMAVGLLAAGWRELGGPLLTRRREVWQAGPLWRMLRLGAPIGVQYFLEFGIFGLVAVMMGILGTIELAGHQVALNLSSLTFMVPLGVSVAGSVLVGQAVGRGDPPAARRSAWLAYAMGSGFMVLSAVTMLLVPRFLAGLYTNDEAVLMMAATLIPIAGLFQVFDGMQVVAGGVLRGLGDTRAPMIINMLGFWLLGFPVSWLLGFHTSLGPRGLWWGLVVGLGAVSLILLGRMRRRLSWSMSRVVIDEEATRRSEEAELTQ